MEAQFRRGRPGLVVLLVRELDDLLLPVFRTGYLVTSKTRVLNAMEGNEDLVTLIHTFGPAVLLAGDLSQLWLPEPTTGT